MVCLGVYSDPIRIDLYNTTLPVSMTTYQCRLCWRKQVVVQGPMVCYGVYSDPIRIDLYNFALPDCKLYSPNVQMLRPLT